MIQRGWNHNDQYRPLVMKSVPSPCAHALDVGCGRGGLTRLLAERCSDVTGIEIDAATAAAADLAEVENAAVVCGDIMSYPFEAESFDLVTAVATLHHLPLEAALVRFRDLLKPGGVLVVVGLYRPRSLPDYLLFALAKPVSWAVRALAGARQVAAPMQKPAQTLGELKSAAATLLPGAVLRRRFFFRYTLIWRKTR